MLSKYGFCIGNSLMWLQLTINPGDNFFGPGSTYSHTAVQFDLIWHSDTPGKGMFSGLTCISAPTVAVGSQLFHFRFLHAHTDAELLDLARIPIMRWGNFVEG